MNKRKTLRMTSILLALMMFFGMVSVLLVPAGTAGAADAQVDIVIDSTTSSTYDSDNIIVLDDKTYTLKVSKLLWGTDNTNFTSVRMVLKDYANNEVAGYTSSNPKVMTASSTESGMYTCEFVASILAYNPNTAGKTGLYTMELRRYYADNTMDTTAITVGAFWLAAPHISGQNGIWIASNKVAENNNIAYVGPGATIEYHTANLATMWSATQSSNGFTRIVNPNQRKGFIGEVTWPNMGGGLVKYTVPSNTAHDTALTFEAMGVNPDFKNCYMVYFNNTTLTTVTNKYKAIVDAKGPEIGEIVLQNPIYINRLWEDFVVRSHGLSTPGLDANYVEIGNISDENSGFAKAATTNAYVLFENPFNSVVKVGGIGVSPINYFTRTSLVSAGGATSQSYFMTEKNADETFWFNMDVITLLPASTPAGFYDLNLSGNRFNVSVVATDAVGNETKKTYGIVDFLGNYVQINEIRVEQQNVLEMYVGQTINYEDVLFNGVKIAMNSNASFPENYIWFANNDAATLKLFDFDYDAKTITAKAAGEGRIYVDPWINYIGESTVLNASKNGYMKVIVHEQPTVSSLTLSSSKLALAVGAEHKLTATIVPAGVTATWSSSETSVATVDQNGNVKAVAAGTTTVSVAAGGKYAVCTVTVTDATIVDPDPPAEDLKGWVDEGNNRYYYVDNQKVVGWRKIDGSWYFFDYSTAAMRANGWLKEGGKWYYLNSNGTMKSAEWFKDNNGKWYWLKANGAMAAGWEKINGTWYYFNASGAMQTGWVNVRGIWYYMKSSGAMAEGWLQDGSSWYYLTPGGGAMVTGRVTINGRASNFAASGRWLGYV